MINQYQNQDQFHRRDPLQVQEVFQDTVIHLHHQDQHRQKNESDFKLNFKL